MNEAVKPQRIKLVGPTVLSILGLLIAIIAAALFAVAPIIEEMVGGWSFEYDGQLWGLYQWGYPPIGLVNNISLGYNSLFVFAMQISEDLAIFNVRAVIADVVLLLFLIFWIITIVKVAKTKAKGVGVIILSAFSFLIAFTVGIAMTCAPQYLVGTDGYSYLVDSVFVNAEVTQMSRTIVVLAAILSLVAQLFVLLALIISVAKAKTKKAEPVQNPVARPVTRPQVKSVARPAPAPQRAPAPAPKR